MHRDAKILVVDDEAGIRDGLKTSLEHLGFSVATADSGESALSQMRSQTGISFVISDFKMAGMDGFEVLKQFKKYSPSTRVVMMTGYGNVHHAVNAMQLGADDYLCKPFKFEDLEKIILKSLPLTKEIATAPLSGTGAMILSQDADFQILLKKAERAAKSQAPILIEGASGTGKELLARQIHEWSPRKNQPWVAVNCAALPAGLLESELFGFEKGAFTGAMDKKLGKFEQANSGTLLLDEIGDLDLVLQAKLLRVLQEGEVDRLGGRKSLKIDVRVIATTNRNLEKLVGEGKFREDLFFRLYGVRFILPALRERARDIPLLIQEFLARQAREQGRDFSLAAEVIPVLEKMNWSGNIRELERAVERAAVLSETGLIEIKHFEFGDTPLRTRQLPLGNGEGVASAPTVARSIRSMEKDIILKALRDHAGNRTHTAKALDMSLRTLRHKLKQYRDEGAYVDEPTRQNSLGKIEPAHEDDAALTVISPTSSSGQNLAWIGAGR